ncbi:MAG: hypothetical protein H7A21_04985 [Spirochaetales bacterium]|nr:hypothetical protein [Leptospiraceae bacterium]MCP5480769.1 hypothetical protein [Spirochaetales bacterium]
MSPDARGAYREGICEAVVGNYDAAEYHLLRAAEIEATVSTYATLGWLYGSVLSEPRRAFRFFRRAIRMNPENGDLFNDCGALLLKEGHSRAAVKWLLRAVRARECSKRHFALYNLALVYRRWNRPERSRRFLRLALRTEPDFPQARELLVSLDEPSHGLSRGAG